MALALSLATIFGKPIAEKLLNGLTSRKDGSEKLAAATIALAQGASAVEALKKAFGREFLSVLNETLGSSSTSSFSYEAGTQNYIPMNDVKTDSTQSLRDELNINLDRLVALDTQSVDTTNHFSGLMAVWQQRCLQVYGNTHQEDINGTFAIMQRLLSGELRNYRQIYRLLSATSLGGMGAMMIIGGVIIATSTGVGVVTATTVFLFGVPWAIVGALVLPGALLIVVAAKKTRPVDAMTLSVALAYKLLERIDRVKH